MYVNGAYKNAKDKSELAKLIHDFTCSKADNMYIDLMAKKTRQYKETKKGETHMCKVMEEAVIEDRSRTAVRLLTMGKFSNEDIAKGTDLPLETVEELAKTLAKEHGKNPA